MATSQFQASAGVTIDGVHLENGAVDLNGSANGLILDANGDTKILASTDDQIEVHVNGARDFKFTSNLFEIESGSAIGGPGSTFVPLIPIAAQQALSGAGAVNVTTFYTAWTTTAANAGTLADGVIKGQLKKIKLVTDGGDGTLTPTNLAGGSTITFADVGDYVILAWDGTEWVAIELGNDADGSTAPVLA